MFRTPCSLLPDLDLVAWYYLRVAAAGSSAFYSESGSLRGLPDASERILPSMGGQSLHQSKSCSALPFPERRWRDSDDEDILSIRLVLQPFQDVQTDLCLFISIEGIFILLEPDLTRQHLHVFRRLRPGDFDVTRHG